jgi:phospholipid transport system substrate-binding protein
MRPDTDHPSSTADTGWQIFTAARPYRSMLLPLLLPLLVFATGAKCAETPTAPSPEPPPRSPEQLVRITSDTVVAKVKANRSALERDRTKIYQLVESDLLPHSDFVLMSRKVLGKHWADASATQQQAFIHQFQQLLIRTYATALLKYAETEVEYLPYRPREGSAYAVVKTRVRLRGAPAIPIDYLLHQNADSVWKVVDIKIDNLSLVANYQSSFTSQLRNIGLDGLLQQMSERNRQLGGITPVDETRDSVAADPTDRVTPP